MRSLKLVALFMVLATMLAFGQTPIPITPSGTADDQPIFSWTSTAGATWYWVWVSRQGDSSYAAVAQKWVQTATMWTAETPLPEGDYVFWVQAWGESTGYSAWSAGQNFTVATEKTIAIPPAAFQGRNETDGRLLQVSYLAPDGNSDWLAPLSLPVGAIITRVRLIFYNDGAVSIGPELWVRRAHMATASGEEHLAYINKTATMTSGFYQPSTTSIDNPTVESGYSYSILVSIYEANTSLRGVEVTYRE